MLQILQTVQFVGKNMSAYQRLSRSKPHYPAPSSRMPGMPPKALIRASCMMVTSRMVGKSWVIWPAFHPDGGFSRRWPGNAP